MATQGKTGRKRGRSKPVIDYDPLAWLDEEGEQDPSAEPQAGAAEDSGEPATQTPVEDAVAKAEPEKDSADEAAPEAPQSDPGYGFFEDEEPAAAMEKGSEPENDSPDSGYGFFDDTPGDGTATDAWKDEGGAIHLGAELVIRNVAQAQRLLGEILSRGFDVRIDAGDLQKIDSAGLQMIYSLAATLEKNGQKIHWERPSPLIDQRGFEIGLPSLCPLDDKEGEEGVFGFF